MVSVIVLSYNTRELTLKCLESLHRSEGVKWETIVIDNASSDGSARAIAKNFPQARLTVNKINVGFAAGNNQGMAQAKGDAVLLLNSDCFVEKDTLKLTYEFLVSNVLVDVVGCKLLNKDGSVQPNFGYFPTLGRIWRLMTFVDNFPIIRGRSDSIHVRDLGRYKKTLEVDWVMGACVMLKRRVWENVGGLDENYFTYGEEVEWMYRMKRAGFNIFYFPGAKAVHLQGASTKNRSKMFASEMKGYIYWYKKHNSFPELLALEAALVFGCLIRIPAWWVMGRVMGKPGLPREYVKILPEIIASIGGK